MFVFLEISCFSNFLSAYFIWRVCSFIDVLCVVFGCSVQCCPDKKKKQKNTYTKCVVFEAESLRRPNRVLSTCLRPPRHRAQTDFPVYGDPQFQIEVPSPNDLFVIPFECFVDVRCSCLLFQKGAQMDPTSHKFMLKWMLTRCLGTYWSPLHPLCTSWDQDGKKQSTS